VTGLELRSVDFDSSGLCPMDSENLWLVIMPKSKDRFMKRSPMKQYNHEPIWVHPGVVRGRTEFGVSIGGVD
jgi:hypothetical protein